MLSIDTSHQSHTDIPASFSHLDHIDLFWARDIWYVATHLHDEG